MGTTPIGQVQDRRRAHLRGVVKALAAVPHGAVTWLETQLADPTGEITLIWMGRSGVPGIAAGRELVVDGLVSQADGQRRMFNPRYELVAGSGTR